MNRKIGTLAVAILTDIDSRRPKSSRRQERVGIDESLWTMGEDGWVEQWKGFIKEIHVVKKKKLHFGKRATSLFFFIQIKVLAPIYTIVHAGFCMFPQSSDLRTETAGSL
jgi:hypothetical protein